ncbi:MAG: endonuclease VIII [Clostridia bacterium]
MIEIPEAQTLAKQSNQFLTGRTMTKVEANHTPHGFAWYAGDPAQYPQILTDRVIESAFSVGGFVRIQAQDSEMVFFDGVNLRLIPAGTKRPAKHQFIAELDDGSALVVTTQMYGGIMAFAKGAWENGYYQVAADKPSPLSDEFSEVYFDKLCAGLPGKLSVKALLATEQRIPGLGNGVLQDILFISGIHPKKKLSALTAKTKAYLSNQTVLREMTDQGGAIRKGSIKCARGIRQSSAVRPPGHRAHGECHHRRSHLGGSIYYCPSCQQAE